jgi:hypothetical protein
MIVSYWILIFVLIVLVQNHIGLADQVNNEEGDVNDGFPALIHMGTYSKLIYENS